MCSCMFRGKYQIKWKCWVFHKEETRCRPLSSIRQWALVLMRCTNLHLSATYNNKQNQIEKFKERHKYLSIIKTGEKLDDIKILSYGKDVTLYKCQKITLGILYWNWLKGLKIMEKTIETTK